MTDNDDVPSPIDLRLMADAREWAGEAMVKRPWRTDFFDAFTRELQPAGRPLRVLELGAGPGFLAQHVLTRRPDLDYVALDFSDAMHELAGERLGGLAPRVRFVQRDFLQPDWPAGLGTFDHVLTHQAVHELRHKRRARVLHEQVRGLLAPGGSYLVCDHILGGGFVTEARLYMTEAEQVASLQAAGFTRVETVLRLKGLALQRASH